MRYEAPCDLLGRLRLGREEFCQRLLTMLILGGPYPRWNSRSRPSPAGERFLAALHALSFGADDWAAEGVFVDEFELVKRHDSEAGGAPDWAVLWPDRVWIVELKTERASHRPAQIPTYFELTHHHYPTCSVDITYLTPPLSPGVEPPGPWGRFAHLTWDAIVPLLQQVWSETDDRAVLAVLDGVFETIATMGMRPAAWRASYLADAPATTVPPPPAAPVEVASPPADIGAAALALAEQTSQDGTQRALEFTAANLEELQQLRLSVRTALSAAPEDSALRHVMPWLWSSDSGGKALTVAGGESGYELRFSRYAKPLY